MKSARIRGIQSINQYTPQLLPKLRSSSKSRPFPNKHPGDESEDNLNDAQDSASPAWSNATVHLMYMVSE